MNTPPLFKRLSVTCLFAVCAIGARAKNVDISEPEDLGDNTFSIRVEANSTFYRDLPEMKITARETADNFCAAHHKQLRVISLDTRTPWVGTGFFSATITFKALDSSSPELAPPNAGIPSAPVVYQAPTPPVNIVSSTDDLYAALTKLDDLRKKGILTDEEFQAEKKRILSHTN
jgi:hypothetical protein